MLHRPEELWYRAYEEVLQFRFFTFPHIFPLSPETMETATVENPKRVLSLRPSLFPGIGGALRNNRVTGKIVKKGEKIRIFSSLSNSATAAFPGFQVCCGKLAIVLICPSPVKYVVKIVPFSSFPFRVDTLPGVGRVMIATRDIQPLGKHIRHNNR